MTPSTGASKQQAPVFGDRIMLRQYLHWNRLIGARVQIRQNGRIIRTGTIDDAMADSTTLWIAGDAAQPRTMYEAARGIEVWAEPEEVEDGLCYSMTSTAPARN
ncbi:hypothetical protein [Pseudarthrobacter sp. BRE9]|jgi:hypothetical protein|uniref:hypothetical protein n=1 Tax=Pseudarthrobacter sp. BRE9 TaxID=2962582 RepID=UPI0028823459|nr:hypothetical protein [Pseudarthrobacter sp. BRE9]MDT0170240.1 hypothetical protein [Pseudarthrobacter sp. BRE9]